ncbi:hypothetical protein TNCV_1782811 [Trichonephila clavipes]|nr:hypothetical protein TNCV_1782811 [Trichonephila clavipes]
MERAIDPVTSPQYFIYGNSFGEDSAVVRAGVMLDGLSEQHVFWRGILTSACKGEGRLKTWANWSGPRTSSSAGASLRSRLYLNKIMMWIILRVNIILVHILRKTGNFKNCMSTVKMVRQYYHLMTVVHIKA